MSVFNLAVAPFVAGPGLSNSGGYVYVNTCGSLTVSGSCVSLINDLTTIPGGGPYFYGTSNTGGQPMWLPLDSTITGAFINNDQFTGYSGFAAGTYATITNLALSGSRLYGDIVGLSGVVNGVSINLGSTGSYLYNLIAALSGVNTGAFATIVNLAATGSTLYSDIGVLSTQVTGLSGVYNASFGSVSAYTGNITIGAPVWRYTWSGANQGAFTGYSPTGGGTSTGTLPAASAYSGEMFMVSNTSTGAWLLLSGAVNQGTNYVVYPTCTVDLLSNGATWLVT